MRTIYAAVLFVMSASSLVAQPSELPNTRLTPGAIGNTNLAQVCTPGYSHTVRHTSKALKGLIYREYGVPASEHAQYEVDHLVPLCAGGADTDANLWAQPRFPVAGDDGWTAADKDRLELCVCRLLCEAHVPQQDIASRISHNWIEAYEYYIPQCRARGLLGHRRVERSVQ